MHPIKIVRFCLWYSSSNSSDELEAAGQLLRAVQGEHLTRSALVPLMVERGEWLLHEGSRAQAFHWFGKLAARELRESPLLVPVPDRACTSQESVRESPTFQRAKAIEAESGLRAAPLLFWDEPLKRGPRKTKELFQRLRIDDTADDVERVVWIGGLYERSALQAYEARLRIHRAILVDQALCVGRPVKKPADPIFGKRVLQVERFLDVSVVSIRPRLAKHRAGRLE